LSIRYLYKRLSDKDKRVFIELLIRQINPETFDDIKNKYEGEYYIVILSASPDEYVKDFAKEIGWEGYGSYLDAKTGKYNHLHGAGKLEFLKINFPSSRYSYSYAISDSPKDLEILKMFDSYDLIEIS
jgi:phosphoserine phosphatase